MRGLVSLTLTLTLACLLSMPDGTQSLRAVKQLRHADRAKRGASQEAPHHRARRDGPSIIPDGRYKRDTSSFPTTTGAPDSSGVAWDLQRVVRDFLVEAIKHADAANDDAESWTDAVLEFLLKKLHDSGSLEGIAEDDIRRDFKNRFGGDDMESHLKKIAEQMGKGEVTSHQHHLEALNKHHRQHDTVAHHGGSHHAHTAGHSGTTTHGGLRHHVDGEAGVHQPQRGHRHHEHQAIRKTQAHHLGHRPEHTKDFEHITSTAAYPHHQQVQQPGHIVSTPAPAHRHHGNQKQHLLTEGTAQQGSSESFINDNDFEWTPESVKSHVDTLLHKMDPQQIEGFIVFLDNIDAEVAIKNGEIAIIPSEAIKAHINMVFDKLEVANETHVERALHVILHYLHGFEYTEFGKIQGNSESSIPEDPTLEFARGYALDMIDNLLARQGEEGMQTALAEMAHLLKKFEHHFSIDPLHTKHERHRHHGDGTLATVESVTALVNKIFGELENHKDKSDTDYELKILAQILESFTGHHGHQREHPVPALDDADEDYDVTLESVREPALELVQTLGSHKQTTALADLANMLVLFESRESDTEPNIHFEGKFKGSSHNANAEPDAVKRLADEIIDRYVAENDEAKLTTVLRAIVAYLLELETGGHREHHKGNVHPQNDEDVDGSEDEAGNGDASEFPEEDTGDEANTNPSMPFLPTIGNRYHGTAALNHMGFAAEPEETGIGSGIPGRGIVGSHKTPRAPAHTIGLRGLKKRR
ncbi:uncharacterized protein [Haliotis cracherodii]|uniref:uncharacterized protein n=1 Tax=Haliotis cracherodii TaxID=6455 RepID=UPI0039ECFC48